MPHETADIEAARVDGSISPTESGHLRALAQDLGLGWQQVRQLWSTGLLSFDPDGADARVDAQHRAEFVFLGHLAAAGLSADAITLLVRGLRRPYAYDLSRIYFDWSARAWRLLPVIRDPESAFFAMLAQLDARREGPLLLEIRELVESALDLARGRCELYRHESPAGRASQAQHYVRGRIPSAERDCPP